MKVHFIAIGGSAMHNLAIALSRSGDTVTGSDDEIVEPSKGRLQREGLLPEKMGWDSARVTNDLDAVIVGMHARADNPELARARELGLRIYSYPEYVYERTKDKTRIVIGGSHGKTTITSMILHVLNVTGIRHDYLVGAQLEGYDCMVGFSLESKIAVIEGDEYLSSPEDRRPKFHLYRPHIALISGIAWDHINVFPTFENYAEQFGIFVDLIEPNGALVYFKGDEILSGLAKTRGKQIEKLPYDAHPAKVKNGVTYLQTEEGKEIAISVFGQHNLQNLNGARLVLNRAGVSDEQFYHAIPSFRGASRRLELLGEKKDRSIFRDFAHSPSKLKATVAAVKEQFPDRRLIACMELHTFSSLTAAFLKEYAGCMDQADIALVYFNPHTIAHKRVDPISEEQVKEAFAREDLQVYTASSAIITAIRKFDLGNSSLLLMSSGNFDGVDLPAFAKELLEN
ncbi:MAG: UDP-N-acetylmuramate--L-alanine ligase [Flavobacteriales bacterium]